ncbi:glycogen debranching enzyme-like [Eurytemora carolleeae]|uniref:glycogen debranching enzyme-like n=1 Tax=Eurytemora carolleeae TaxID=1294199 RepID=UPI000C75B85A|nr:glycogen debranching enzyme-like [Eurytemora carolleeae]|eukprot:XP_023341981.1 glycogen debranching enzyme-like [Eurytemora affinis]
MVVMIVKELELEKEKHLDSVIYKLDKNEFLRFRIGPTLLGSKVRLFTNYPIKGEFFRETFYELKWEYSSVNDSTSYFSDVKVLVPGSYIFYYTTSGKTYLKKY